MTWQDHLEVAANRSLAAMPIDVCSAIGGWLGQSIARRQYPPQDGRTRTLLATLRPDWARDPVALEAAVGRTWANAGRVYAEFSVLDRMFRDGRHTWQGEAYLRDISSHPTRPTIALFTHTGNWEMSGFGMAHFFPGRSASIAYVPPQRHRAAMMSRIRSRAPWRNLPMGRRVWRDVLGLLGQPGGIFLASADEIVAGQIHAPRFGRPIKTDGQLGKVARLALKSRARLILVFNERLDGARFVTHVLPFPDLAGDARDEGAVAEAVRRFDEAISPHILRLLDQWHFPLKVGQVTLRELAAVSRPAEA